MLKHGFHSTVEILSRMLLCCGRLPCVLQDVYSFPCLSSLDAISTIFPGPILTTKNVPTMAECFLGAETPLIASHSVNIILYKRESFSTINWSDGNCVTYLHFANLFMSGSTEDSWFSFTPCLQLLVITSVISIICFE